MVRLIFAVRTLEELYLDEFKSSCRDKVSRPLVLLNLHQYFRYQTKIYTFTSVSHVGRIYNDLRLGRITDTPSDEVNDISYSLIFLTELAQRLIVHLANPVIDEEGVFSTLSPNEIIRLLAQELSEVYTLHAYHQDYVKDEYYQSTFNPEEWTDILIKNPWLLVGCLIKMTSNELTEKLYLYFVEAKELLKELES